METLAKADIFFFITSIVVVVLGILAVVIAFYIIRILRIVKEVAENTQKEVKEIIDDVSSFRQDVKDGISTTKRYSRSLLTGLSLQQVFAFLINTVAGAAKQKRSRRKPSSRSSKEEAED